MNIRNIFKTATFLLIIAINIAIFSEDIFALPWSCTSTFTTVAVNLGQRWTYGCRQTVMCNGELWSETVFYVYEGNNEWDAASVANWCQ
jgi:hypothetical protein